MVLDLSERLLAGVVLAVTGLGGLVYRFTAYGKVIGDLKTGFMFYGTGYTLLSLIISAIFIIAAVLGIYIVYDTFKKMQVTDNHI